MNKKAQTFTVRFSVYFPQIGLTKLRTDVTATTPRRALEVVFIRLKMDGYRRTGLIGIGTTNQQDIYKIAQLN